MSDRGAALLFTLLIHLLVFGLLVFSWSTDPSLHKAPVIPPHVKATMVETSKQKKAPVSKPKPEQKPAPKPEPKPKPKPKPKPEPKPEPKPTVSRRPDKSSPLTGQSQTVSNVNWRWPHVGTVIAGYSTSGKVNKGIDIAGKAGDSVRAAASGNVVYAGSGLLGYGNLIIVNHNEHYLSAYAHNRKILVQEGEDVKAGQVIAELGNSGTDRPKLHFEIRKNGNPVDPAHYLPGR
jgi:lipoprotein NlpD